MKFSWEVFKIKITSRKLWVAIGSFVSLLMGAYGFTENETAQMVSIIMAGGVVIGYLFANGLSDK